MNSAILAIGALVLLEIIVTAVDARLMRIHDRTIAGLQERTRALEDRSLVMQKSLEVCSESLEKVESHLADRIQE